ncbi:GNAT family N-acetyltransferase [Kiloniella antarctica]|uniref:GNAT family N-acetyltransferase n=1 Tax=Kiloniella antarctica TaxID=1550907 RepID=A0ABW5BM09_9PROT
MSKPVTYSKNNDPKNNDPRKAGEVNAISSCAFTTRRIAVKAWGFTSVHLETVQDVKLEAELLELLTPAVTMFLPEPLQLSQKTDRIASWIIARNSESTVLEARDKSTHALLGVLILAVTDDADCPLEIRLGYLLREKSWGRGIASELLKGLVAWCRENHLPVHFLGGVERGNPASASVLIKTGFKRSNTLSSEKTDIFELSLGAKLL